MEGGTVEGYISCDPNYTLNSMLKVGKSIKDAYFGVQ